MNRAFTYHEYFIKLTTANRGRHSGGEMGKDNNKKSCKIYFIFGVPQGVDQDPLSNGSRVRIPGPSYQLLATGHQWMVNQKANQPVNHQSPVMEVKGIYKIYKLVSWIVSKYRCWSN